MPHHEWACYQNIILFLFLSLHSFTLHPSAPQLLGQEISQPSILCCKCHNRNSTCTITSNIGYMPVLWKFLYMCNAHSVGFSETSRIFLSFSVLQILKMLLQMEKILVFFLKLQADKNVRIIFNGTFSLEDLDPYICWNNTKILPKHKQTKFPIKLAGGMELHSNRDSIAWHRSECHVAALKQGGESKIPLYSSQPPLLDALCLKEGHRHCSHLRKPKKKKNPNQILCDILLLKGFSFCSPSHYFFRDLTHHFEC